MNFREKVKYDDEAIPVNREVLFLMFREDKPIAADDLAIVRVPDNKLFLRMVRIEIIFIEVERLARSAAGMPEGELTYAAYLVHQQGRGVVVKEIDLVVGVVGLS